MVNKVTFVDFMGEAISPIAPLGSTPDAMSMRYFRCENVILRKCNIKCMWAITTHC